MDVEDWDLLSDEQKQGIEDAIEEIDAGKGIDHETVMENVRTKWGLG